MDELIHNIKGKFDISKDQAWASVGGILTLVKSFMGNDFGNIQNSIPDVAKALQKAPKISTEPSGFVESIGSSIASMLGTDNDFVRAIPALAKNLNVDSAQITKMIPMVFDYIDQQGLGEVAGKLRNFMK